MFSPSLPLLKQLHWLLVSYRIYCKLSTLTYGALSTLQPPYLARLLSTLTYGALSTLQPPYLARLLSTLTYGALSTLQPPYLARLLSTLTYGALSTLQPPYLASLLSTLTYGALSTLQPPYLARLLHLSNIPRQLRSSTSQLKTSETIAVFRKKLKTSIPNCISTITVRLSLVLILTFARPCSRLCLMNLFAPLSSGS